MIRAILTGGKTGGHVFPSLGFWDAFKSRVPGAEALFVGVRGGIEEKTAGRAGIPIKYIYAGTSAKIKLPGGFLLSWLVMLVRIFIGSFQSAIIIIRFRPDFIFATGSFVSIPVLFAGVILRKPIFLHEQNVIFGRANSLFKNFAKGIFTAFDQAPEIAGQARIFSFGNPLRKSVMPCLGEDLREIRTKGLTRDGRVMLIIGGSQGALALNTIVLDALSYLEKVKKKKYRLLHIAGEADAERVRAYYKRFSVASDIRGFEEKMSILYNEADLIIARAGGTTLAEANAWSLPMILFPILRSVRDHQRKNAEHEKKAGAAVVLDEAASSGLDLYKAIDFILDDTARYHIMSQKSASLAKPDAGEKIVDKILEILKLEYQ